MEGSENDSDIKVLQDLNLIQSNNKKIGQHTLSHISDCSKEIDGANDSSLDYLAKELFNEESNSNHLSSNQLKNSIKLEFQDEGVVLADLPECSGLVNFIDKTLTLSNQNIIQVLSETLDNNKKQSEKYSITFHDLLEGFKYDCHVITEQLKGVKGILDKSGKNKISIKDLMYFVNFGLKKMKDVEKIGNIIFEKYQQSKIDKKERQKLFTKAIEMNKSTILNKLQNFKLHLNCANEDDKVAKYRELLKQEKQAFIEQSKIISQAEIENKILKTYIKDTLTHVGHELGKIIKSDKYFSKIISKINQSDSIHIDPGFGGSSRRMKTKSRNSISHNNSDFEIEEKKDQNQNNQINLQRNQINKNVIETSGFIGNNISGTTGGDDDPVLKFNNMLRKSEEKEIEKSTLNRIVKLKEMVSKCSKLPFKAVFNMKKYQNIVSNKDANFNKTISQDSINQAFTSFFGYSDIKEIKNDLSYLNSENCKQDKVNFSLKEIQKDNSFSILKDLEINPPLKESQAIKEFREEIKEQSFIRKQKNKNIVATIIEDECSDKDVSIAKEKYNFSEISEIKEEKENEHIFEVEESNINFTKESLEPIIDSRIQKENDLKYLNYVDEMQNKINSRSFGEEQIDNDSSSIYSEHRLRSSSSECQSTIKFEETQGRTYVVKKIDEQNTVKIPQLNLENIIEKQKKKMYPFNLNHEGEVVEADNPDSSIGTHNDEDAFIYDEQDQEESSSFLNGDINQDKKYSNLFDNSFFSDLSSVNELKLKGNSKQVEKHIEEIKNENSKHDHDQLIMIGDMCNSSNHNSFLDQDLNMESMLLDHNEKEISMICDENSKSNMNILNDFISNEKQGKCQNNLIFGSEIQLLNNSSSKEVRQNNFMRSDSNEDFDKLDFILKNDNGIQIYKNSRDKKLNCLNDKDSKAKSVPADGRKINEDHVTFGNNGYDVNDEPESIMKNFECFNAQRDAIHQNKDDDFKNRNKSVVIPRSSILLKNKKNIQKRNLDFNTSENIKQNNSVSPPKLDGSSNKFSNLVHNENEYKSHDKNLGKIHFKDPNKSKFNFKPSNILLKGEVSHLHINENIKKNKIKLVRNKIIPFKLIKKTKTSVETECRNPSLQLNHNVQSGVKPIISAQMVKVMKTEISQDFKMKGRKLNLRLKEFSQKKSLFDYECSNKVSSSYQSDIKNNKIINSQMDQNSDYVDDSKKVTNLSNYNTNSLVVHPKGREENKALSSLFSINQRRLNK